MALAVEIPAPRPGDSAQVVTSLENAALFGRIGDSEEALHWLQRAAESASETGDDERTLALARVAADLKSTLPPPGSASSTPLPNGERRLPAPPPRSRPAQSSPVSAAPPVASPAPREAVTEAPREVAPEEPTLLLNRPVLPKVEGQAPGRPPPPSSRPQASRPPQQSVHALPAPAAVNGASSSVAPASSAWRPARVRQAARVSVEKSKTEPGLYLVRVLDEGRSAESGRSEALLVSLEPGVGLF